MNKNKLGHKVLSALLALFVAIPAMLGCFGSTTLRAADTEPIYPFTDVPKWAISVVNTVYEKGIMNGSGATTFNSEGTFTREQIAATLYRMSGSTDAGTADELKSVFADADKISSWAVKEVKWAYENEITTGIERGGKLYFDPKAVLTREQAATFIMRYVDYMDIDVATDKTADIKDLDKVSRFAKTSVSRSIAAGIITGDGNGYFNPVGDTNRVSAAAMLARIPEAKAERPVSLDEHDPNPENIGAVVPSSDITVAEGFKLSQVMLMDDSDPSGNEYTVTGTGNHGWHETRVIRNEYGTYIVFAQDEYLDHTGYYLQTHYYAVLMLKFMLVQVTDSGFNKVYEGYYPLSLGGSCGPNVIVGEDGIIYIVTISVDPETYLGSELQGLAAHLGVHEFDTKTNKIVNVSTDLISFENPDPDLFQIGGVPNLPTMNPGKPHPVLDVKNGKIHALFGCGGVEGVGYVSWFNYDIKSATWEKKNYNARTPDGAFILQYFNLFADGDGGIYGIGCRVSDPNQMAEMYQKLYGESIKFDSSGYMWDAVYLFSIPDMTKEELIVVDEPYVPDYLNEKDFPRKGGMISQAVANTYDGGCTFLASNGYLYVVFNAQGEDKYVIYDVNDNFKKVRSPKKLILKNTNSGNCHYQFAVGENMNGEVFLVAIDSLQNSSELELYRFDIKESKINTPMLTYSDGKAASVPLKIKGTSAGLKHYRLSATTTRSYSIQDNVLGIVTSCAPEKPTDLRFTSAADIDPNDYNFISWSGGPSTTNFYYYAVELPH